VNKLLASLTDHARQEANNLAVLDSLSAFQVAKLLAAPTTQDKVDPDRFEDWISSTEEFNSHINKINELAYTSSFGEYNPGGGKEQVRMG
jgi:hypothetical protein